MISNDIVRSKQPTLRKAVGGELTRDWILDSTFELDSLAMDSESRFDAIGRQVEG